MASVLNKTTLEFISSVNTPDYPEDKYIINPDMSAVAGVPQKYWKLAGSVPVPMTDTEKTAKDSLLKDKIPKVNCPYGYTDKCEYQNG